MQFSNSLAKIWNIISRNNKYIDETAPWILAKNEENEKLASVMYHLIENLRKVGILLQPFMPDTAENILRQIGVTNSEHKTWDSIKSADKLLVGVQVIEKGEPIFMRLNIEEEVEYIREGMKAKN